MSDPISSAIAAALEPVIRAAVRAELAEVQSAEPAPALLTCDELCVQLRCSRSLLGKLRTEGMPELRLCDSPRFRLADVLAWLERKNKT